MAQPHQRTSRRMPQLFPDPLDKMTTLIVLIVLLRLLGGC
jgi:hypothetical protein